MTATRRAAVEQAFAQVSRPRTLTIRAPAGQRGMSLYVAGEIARHDKEPAVGGTTKLLYALPAEDQSKVKQVASLYADQRNMGRHGNPQGVLDAFEVPRDVAEAVVDGLEVDYVAAQLQRRRGTDGDRPLPDLTRRDYIDAAIEAHASKE